MALGFIDSSDLAFQDRDRLMKVGDGVNAAGLAYSSSHFWKQSHYGAR
jgi:hypothetical protein